MINRNRGSGTRWIIGQLLEERAEGNKPPGYAYEARNHPAVAAAIIQSRADWGVTLETVARDYDLAFEPLREERYDFVIPKVRLDRAAVRAFLDALRSSEVRSELAARGFNA